MSASLEATGDLMIDSVCVSNMSLPKYVRVFFCLYVYVRMRLLVCAESVCLH